MNEATSTKTKITTRVHAATLRNFGAKAPWMVDMPPHWHAGPIASNYGMPQAKSARTRFERANPILSVANMARSLRYYVDVLGFSNAHWGGDDFTCVSRDGADIYLSEGDQGQPGTWVWIGVEDVEVLFEEYKQSGATILHPPENFPWACEMKVGDPDGHVLRFGSDPEQS